MGTKIVLEDLRKPVRMLLFPGEVDDKFDTYVTLLVDAALEVLQRSAGAFCYEKSLPSAIENIVNSKENIHGKWMRSLMLMPGDFSQVQPAYIVRYLDARMRHYVPQLYCGLLCDVPRDLNALYDWVCARHSMYGGYGIYAINKELNKHIDAGNTITVSTDNYDGLTTEFDKNLVDLSFYRSKYCRDEIYTPYVTYALADLFMCEDAIEYHSVGEQLMQFISRLWLVYSIDNTHMCLADTLELLIARAPEVLSPFLKECLARCSHE